MMPAVSRLVPKIHSNYQNETGGGCRNDQHTVGGCLGQEADSLRSSFTDCAAPRRRQPRMSPGQKATPVNTRSYSISSNLRFISDISAYVLVQYTKEPFQNQWDVRVAVAAPASPLDSGAYVSD